MINTPTIKKQWRPGDRRLAFVQKFVLFHKGGSAEGGGSHRKESETDSFAFIRR